MSKEKFESMIAVTNRRLCSGDFLNQIHILGTFPLKAIILREKDLSEEDYEELARQVIPICKEQNMLLIMHTYTEAARRLGCRQIHLPYPLFMAQKDQLMDFDLVGTSVHSVEEAVIAEQAGAHYLTAGHIYDTDCKKGMPGRGTDFLRKVCSAVDCPVYAIGGVTPERMEEVMDCGAAGGCMMSLSMHLKGEI